ncbi:MAG: DUF2807 domain-containing protein [Acidobacteria bacterium]|nr:DUF2807 domain-containing protein [Acidobacteriota bacterium]
MKKIGIIIFIVAIALGVALANAFSFGKATSHFFNFQFGFGGVKGSGNVVTQKRDVTDFKAVQVGGAFDVEIVAQKEFAVEVEGDDNLLELIKTDVSGETLEIRSEKRFSTNGRLKVRISAPDIDKVDLSGASTVNLVGLNNDSLRIESSGASKIKVNGVTKDLVVDMSGASKLDAADLKSVNANVDASGACHIIVAVSGDLKADLSGASKVTYSGNPKNVERKVSGASSVTGN